MLALDRKEATDPDHVGLPTDQPRRRQALAILYRSPRAVSRSVDLARYAVAAIYGRREAVPAQAAQDPTVLLYVLTSQRRGRGGDQDVIPRPFGSWELPIVAGALIWLAYELIILIAPSAFRDAQYYVLGALGLGLVFYVVQLLTERVAMSSEPGQD